MNFADAIDFANRLYRMYREEFMAPTRTSAPIILAWKIRQNQREAFFSNLDAERRWQRRHKT